MTTSMTVLVKVAYFLLVGSRRERSLGGVTRDLRARVPRSVGRIALIISSRGGVRLSGGTRIACSTAKRMRIGSGGLARSSNGRTCGRVVIPGNGHSRVILTSGDGV